MLAPPTQCPYCADWFVPKVKNRFGWQKICGKRECAVKQKNAVSKASVEKNHEHYRLMWQKRNKKKTLPTRPKKIHFLRCFQCDYAILPVDRLCGRCGWTVIVKEAMKAREKYDTFH